MPRFVVLRHETPSGYLRPTHYDLLLEWGSALRTWAFLEFPAPGLTVAAEELPPHRLDYLEYEGQVAGGRGNVTRVAAGEYEIQAEDADSLRVSLSGSGLAGILTMARHLPEKSAWTATVSSTSHSQPRPGPAT